MKLLLINTCGAEGVVALVEAGSVVAEVWLPGRGASEGLVPAIRSLFQRLGWTVGDLAGVGVVTGPGSFTGVRVGLSVAKGLCEAGGVRLVAMSRLALVADALEGPERMALLDAGREEYYVGVYEAGLEPVESLRTEAEVRNRIGLATAVLTCEARVVESLGERVRLVPEPGAEQMLRMASRRIGAGEWSDVALTDAHYLRRTDAELLAKVRAMARS